MRRAAVAVVALIVLIWISPLLRPEKVALRLFLSCAGEERTECYARAVYELYPSFSVPELFAGLRVLQSLDEAAIPCHFIAHRIASVVIAHDPDAWPREMIADPGALCSFGYVHGIAIAAFRDMRADAGVPEDLQHVCDPLSKGRARSNCLHGLGHIAYYAAPDIPAALGVCDAATSDPPEARRCYAGVFMKLFFATPDDQTPDSHGLTRESAPGFCRALGGAYAAECERTSWLLYANDLTDKKSIDQFCASMRTDDDRDLCVERVFRGLAWLKTADLDSFAGICETYDGEMRAECYSAGAIELTLTAPGRKTLQAARTFCARGGDAASARCRDINGTSE